MASFRIESITPDQAAQVNNQGVNPVALTISAVIPLAGGFQANASNVSGALGSNNTRVYLTTAPSATVPSDQGLNSISLACSAPATTSNIKTYSIRVFNSTNLELSLTANSNLISTSAGGTGIVGTAGVPVRLDPVNGTGTFSVAQSAASTDAISVQITLAKKRPAIMV